jgi:hypothetical protein
MTGLPRRKWWTRYLEACVDAWWDVWLDAWWDIARAHLLASGVRIDPVTYERIDLFERDGYASETPLIEHPGTVDG